MTECMLPVCSIPFNPAPHAALVHSARCCRSVAQTAWSGIFDSSGTCTTSERRELRLLFPETHSMNRFDFSDLHKAVLNILSTPLPSLLAKPSHKSEVNHRDSWSRTPLHWAAKASNHEAVSALILAGADVNVSDCMGTTPLHLAARARDPRGLEMLVMAKANTRVRNQRNEEPIHYATHQSMAHVRALLVAGASLQPNDLLHWAITAPTAGVARFLIERGVPSENIDEESNTPLFHAVKYCAHECLDMLLAKGVDTGHVNGEGATILHWAARHGDMRVLEVMRRWGFGAVDVGKRDGVGRTAMQMLENRTGRPVGMKEAHGSGVY